MGSASPARAQQQLRQTFAFTNTLAMLQPEVLVSRAHEKFDRDGRLADQVTRTFVRRFLETFHGWATRMLQPALIPR